MIWEDVCILFINSDITKAHTIPNVAIILKGITCDFAHSK